MQSDMLVQAIRVAEIDLQRRNDRVMDQQLRIARMHRPSLRTRVGQMLISVGERMKQEPRSIAGSVQPKASMAR